MCARKSYWGHSSGMKIIQHNATLRRCNQGLTRFSISEMSAPASCKYERDCRNVVSRSLVEIDWCFESAYCLRHQDLWKVLLLLPDYLTVRPQQKVTFHFSTNFPTVWSPLWSVNGRPLWTVCASRKSLLPFSWGAVAFSSLTWTSNH